MRLALATAIVLAGLAGCAEPPTFDPEPLPAAAVAAVAPGDGDRAWDPEPCDRIGATTVDGAVEPLPFQEMTSSLQAHFLAQYRDDPLTGEVHEEERWTGCMGPGCPDDTVTVRPTEHGEIVHGVRSVFHAEPVDEVTWDEADLEREATDLAEAVGIASGDRRLDVRPPGASAVLGVGAGGRWTSIGQSGVAVADGGYGGTQSNPDWESQRVTRIRSAYDLPEKQYMGEDPAVAIARADVSCLTARPVDDRPALRVRNGDEPSASLMVLDDTIAWRVRVPLTTGHEADCRSEPTKQEWPWVAKAWIDAQTGALHDVEFSSHHPCIVY